ncbi:MULTISPECIES: extensin-like domain-containing protein [unclassified Pseudomonas]|uniref:extensin-like domain-containing protein n=1 Tax=unclassified Pseudomonas TaxID=196821 RepID=UPI0030D792F0
MSFFKIIGVLLVLGGVFAVGIWRGWVPLPADWNPWAPLDVRASPNFLTRYKLGRLQDDPALCDNVLETSGLRVSHQADTPVDVACPLRNTLRVQGAAVGLSSSFLASCPLAVAFALFERHSLQPAAQAVFGQAVTRVDHLGSFACRNMYNRSVGRLSEHASANALDIAGFRLADGRRISVLKGWPGEGADARFLRRVRDSACDDFNVVLTPDYNAAHRNHFHLDMGRWWVCR